MDVHKIARLARLRLSETEATAMQKELEAILGYAKELEALDLSNVKPTSHAGQAGALRSDDVREGMAQERIAKNAPEMNGTAFAVPKVIE